MKITIINGTMRKGSTHHCADAVMQQLNKYDETEVTEFFLPKDMPNFCIGCYSCFYNGEHTCPHNEYIKPIVNAILESDLIVLTSPVYAFDVSGQMKTFLDHLCYMWLSHRPNPKMFDKIALTISTTAGAGLGHTQKTMKSSLKYWGVKKIFSYATPVSAMKWSDVSEKKKEKIDKDTKALAAKIAKSVKNAQKLHNPLFRSFFFNLMKGMQKKNDWNKTDRNHWESLGWLNGNKPF
ncbi:MAG: flavodoxin family protein [Eubacteriaceae bacterium]|nr:flavodoxin family protein [Eubacteriaceae bacterium]